jgi:hypothetical protein
LVSTIWPRTISLPVDSTAAAIGGRSEAAGAESAEEELGEAEPKEAELSRAKSLDMAYP